MTPAASTPRVTGLASWEALPAVSLRRAGPASGGLVGAGCATLRDAGRALHALPYGRNGDRGDWRRVLVEGRGTCSTKHALLAAAAAELGVDLPLTVGLYAMSEANTPGVGPVLAAHGLAAIPEAHCFVVWGDTGIDVTRSGVVAAEPIERFDALHAIAPDQIGAHKVALHRAHLAAWAAGPDGPGLDPDALWRIREACIRALDQSGA